MPEPLLVMLDDVKQTDVALVGGKAAHLGELARIAGVQVPPGFCITTAAFARIAAEARIDDELARLARLGPDDRDAVGVLAAAVRRRIEAVAIPGELAAAITEAVGVHAAHAVRSSATTEDLPTASSAGQQDSYLNIVGAPAILAHVSRCWASLFTDRAVIYRLRHDVDPRAVRIAVIVQQMVVPQSAGILFTADPITGHRKVTSIEASFGLGEALVSGLVNADVYKVRDGAIIEAVIGTKQRAIAAAPAGGTRETAVEPARQRAPALADAQVLQLAALGRRIEAHFGCPQDIEWCLADGDFAIVQSRPITTLFPIPVVGDGEKHVYISAGHQQMMTDAMKPLGISLWQLTTPRPMAEAGGRLFVDVTRALAAPGSRAVLLSAFRRSDPLIVDALQTVLDRGDFIRERTDDEPAAATAPFELDATLVEVLIARNQASVATAKREIQGKSGPALFAFILEDLRELKRELFDPHGMQLIMAAVEATWWLDDHLYAWLGEPNAADALAQSVAHNVTSQMGLALLDVADVIRPYPEVVACLQHAGDDFLDELTTVDGGREARDAIRGFLDRYGMRCAGEIDITRPRWSECPRTLVPLLLGHVASAAPGESARRFARGRQDAAEKERVLLARLRALPDGDRKAAETKQMIDRVRTFIGYREYPKYGMISRYFVYKQALMAEAERLVSAGVLREKEDCFFLRFEELHDAVRTQHRVDEALVRQRRDTFRADQARTPRRVLTSDGEALDGAYRREDVPAGALVGLPVSAGTIEGRARVLLDIASARLEAGDILVTAYTDPSWTPLFVAIAGLVTEVGGQMTHGAVIAREYGLPAVVGVQHATRLIRDGQRIRLDGTSGFVEILDQRGSAPS